MDTSNPFIRDGEIRNSNIEILNKFRMTQIQIHKTLYIYNLRVQSSQRSFLLSPPLVKGDLGGFQ